MIHVCYHTFLSDNSACCHLAVSPFFGGAAPINICLCILVQLTCTLGLLRSILSILTWVSVLLLDVFETCCYAWLPLKYISQQHHNINVTNKLYIFMICASFEDIQKHDTNTDIMSHILPFLLGFPSFQRESRANWTIPAPWPGGGCETARISAQHRSRNCEEMALLGAWVVYGAHVRPLHGWGHGMEMGNPCDILCRQNEETHTHTVQQWKFLIIQRWTHRFQFPIL